MLVVFWQDFVAFADARFYRYTIDRIKIENSAGEWESYDRQVLDFLSIPLKDEPTVPEKKARRLVGTIAERVDC
jgi:hypothetical protein